jgi:hypothetical protein
MEKGQQRIGETKERMRGANLPEDSVSRTLYTTIYLLSHQDKYAKETVQRKKGKEERKRNRFFMIMKPSGFLLA